MLFFDWAACRDSTTTAAVRWATTSGSGILKQPRSNSLTSTSTIRAISFTHPLMYLSVTSRLYRSIHSDSSFFRYGTAMHTGGGFLAVSHNTHTHILSLNCNTHTQPFYISLDFVRDNPGELVSEGTFCHLLDFLVQNEDNTGRHTNNLDGLPPHPD